MSLAPGIVLAPLMGAAISGFLGKRLGDRVVAWVAPGAILISFVLALTVTHVGGVSDHPTVWMGFPWIEAGSLKVGFAFLLDGLSLWMAHLVTGVSFLIHVYSVGYMRGDPGFSRYFAYLNLFVFFMLLLVLSENLLLMFIGWEGVGLCSYLLIGFWFHDTAKARAGMKAFIVNRVGDACFLIAIFLLAGFAGRDSGGGASALSFAGGIDVEGLARSGWLADTVALLFLAGAAGKSAQIPFHVWLPDAMAGPTPVSALIHAATMVTAGVFMVCRLHDLYAVATVASSVVAAVGIATALLAGVIAVAQTDIKRVLAYSTISQLGLMFVAAGVGAYQASMFHLTTHAFFKALLFLGAGAVIHALHRIQDETARQDMRHMGGLARYLPLTCAVFLIGGLALSGVPPFAGFFSKDEILMAAWNRSPLLGGLTLLVTGLTAFYTFRLCFGVFFGPSRAAPGALEHLHLPTAVMWIPLVLLAAASVAGGLLDDPLGRWMAGVLGTGAAGHGGHPPFLPIVGASTALMGVLIAWMLYLYRPNWAVSIARGWPNVLRWVSAKFYVDELYDRVFVRSLLRLKDEVSAFDTRTIDAAVDGSADWLVEAAGLSGKVDDRGVDGAVLLSSSTVVRAGRILRLVQNGVLQNYVLVIFLGVFFVIYVQLR